MDNIDDEVFSELEFQYEENTKSREDDYMDDEFEQSEKALKAEEIKE